ncbi:TPA: hypothetical protein QCR58_003056 [Bacillus cereus]|uniref:Uncharacterized protein n=1 Tax=Bacillus thuringiensis serovar kumamotoensis TaxID=132267 RepID=A0A9X6JK38_BACUK|nr:MULTISPECIES: hypothetical protein [Bacillus cereus group]EKS7844793.1 hypothetical protein [Bacillus cereus]MCU5668086.1 hypothetical protein [Bacillus cereus]MEC2873152.1 hypothetical protein [Bacillus cereus]OTZ68165.1 hypothetical protein BK769_24635 [Bacillus thuringiensis serovar kumamtoensis]PFI76984.1 hypothetical protein COI83_29145 [Bacillus cereus]
MTIKGIVIQPENLYQTVKRRPQIHQGSKLEISNMYITGVRATAIRKGVMFDFSRNESKTTEKAVMKPPRTEPLEYAWKKMNI